MANAYNTISLILVLAVAPPITACTPSNDESAFDETNALRCALQDQRGGLTAGDLELSLIWTVSAGSPDHFVAQRLPLASARSRTVALALEVAPPPRALNDYTGGGAALAESRVGIAHVAVLPAGDDVFDEDRVVGLAEEHLVAYVDRDVQPGSRAERLLGGTLAAGYHVMDVKRLTAAEQARIEQCREKAARGNGDYDACGTTHDRLQAAPDGLRTEIPVRLVGDPALLDWPNWT